jgi:alpha-maltose-1-phosphate synthase
MPLALSDRNLTVTAGPRAPNRTETRLRVGIAASGRFHVLDLARELDALGADVSFYSFVPRKQAEAFGLPSRCQVSMLPILFPLVAVERLLPRFFPRTIERLMCWALDMLVILRMRRCDVFVCMSGIYVQAPRFAKKRYGARVVLHRGSRHILSQKEILARIPKARQVTPFMIERELQGYALADQIAVASAHVVESFAPWPDHARKLSQNPYGVDLDQFPLRDATHLLERPTVLFVGQWSYRKGGDVLAEAIFAMDGVRLIHVGSLSDVPFPADPRFIHHEAVPQYKLKEFYERAHVFALASREDGFGMVISQALASGLPVVCTDRTGGPDLARLPGFARLIRVVHADDPRQLGDALLKALDEAAGKTALKPITEDERQMLGWKCYASRELKMMQEVLKGRGGCGDLAAR